ncbi:putative ornithine carbamoyltransferase [Filobasidium floriforme]|uniref:putative ornithine carbamoyltransferase n=1 Tax=Filobasidium floriforme TaxID=5210 RepID=UPI001E8DF3C5|nr:putative ornithine carbamoyltransferase [Filobasidium floriforme]KAH8082278.1 putative ornithine carbamoyltransferase [Filobasidium floriforme]
MLNKRLADKPMSLMTLADLSTTQIATLIKLSLAYKTIATVYRTGGIISRLPKESVALIFNKRSTRTRVASETAITALGGSALFLGKDDIQLGVNESLEDTARIIGSMTAGIMARVGEHVEVETLAQKAGVPVINALSDLWHPTQILADIMTMYEILTPAEQNPLSRFKSSNTPERDAFALAEQIDPLAALQGKKIVWVGDVNNVLNDMLVSLPRLGMKMAVAAPQGYDKVDPRVWKRVEEAGTADQILITNSPAEALRDADFVVTDTWISMGQEAEKEARLKAFNGFQVTEKLCQESGAKPDWKFLHCLPRKAEEVDDEVFYGPRSHVFREGENRKWTIMACFGSVLVGRDPTDRRADRNLNLRSTLFATWTI